jgi:hypothetical protein
MVAPRRRKNIKRPRHQRTDRPVENNDEEKKEESRRKWGEKKTQQGNKLAREPTAVSIQLIIHS